MKKAALSILVLLFVCFSGFAQEMETDELDLTVDGFIAAADSVSPEELQMSMALLQMMGGMEGLLTSTPEYAGLTPEEKKEFDAVKDILVLYTDSYFQLLLLYKQADYAGLKNLAQECRTKANGLRNKAGQDPEAVEFLDQLAGFYGDLVRLADSKR